MSMMSNSNVEESLSQQYEEHEELQQPSCYPSAPSHELFDISTTVDPSHIISLIRKLLPVENGCYSLRRKTDDLPSFEEHKIENDEKIFQERGVQNGGNQSEAMDSIETFVVPEVLDDCMHHQQKNYESSVVEANWEEFGCTLWDLAANETHAELMVQNFILDVLLANLTVSHTSRVKEICLGIVGNLACHEVSRKQIAAKTGLIDAIVDHLFLDDTSCLCEVFRLITLCFQGGDSVSWIETLKSEHVLSRILWITENTLNTHLIEKCVGLLLAIIGSQQETAAALLPPLVKLGLPSLLINLLAFEMSKLTQEGISERYSVLDIILQAIEAFSVVDDFSTHMSCNEDLFRLVEDLIKHPEKAEIASSCVTAAVLMANIVTDSPNLASRLSQDSCFLQGLFDIFPLASDDNEARSALWSIIARLLCSYQKLEISTAVLQQFVSVLVSNVDVIEDELLDPQFVNLKEESKKEMEFEARLSAITISLKIISDILKHWKSLNLHLMGNTSSWEDNVNEEVDKLLARCSNFVE